MYTWVEALKKEAQKNDVECKQAMTPGFVPPLKHKSEIKRNKILKTWVENYANKVEIVIEWVMKI